MSSKIVNPLVSILMTCYNREGYIAAAIQSVLESTYTNFELIISDDASTDTTVEVVRSFAKIDNRIKFYVNQSNLGDYPNRNVAASYATGKYIKYLDSDDTIAKEGLAKMVAAMEAHPTAALGIAQFESPKNAFNTYPVFTIPEQAYLDHYDGYGILQYGPTGTIIKRDVFISLGCFSKHRFLGDTIFWLKLAATYPIVKIEPGVVNWLVHNGQEYQIGQAQLAYLKYSYPVFIQSLQSTNCPLQEFDINRITKRLKWKHSRDILSLALVKFKPMLAIKIFSASDLKFIELLKGLFSYKRIQ